MSNFTKLTTLSLTALTSAVFVAAPAFAQDTKVVIEPVPDQISADFTAADLDQDSALNADEFVTFAVMRAEGGDESFKDVVLSGEYDTKFNAHDKDASGGVSVEELGHADKSDMMEEKSDEMSEETEEEAPEL